MESLVDNSVGGSVGGAVVCWVGDAETGGAVDDVLVGDAEMGGDVGLDVGATEGGGVDPAGTGYLFVYIWDSVMTSPTGAVTGLLLGALVMIRGAGVTVAGVS